MIRAVLGITLAVLVTILGARAAYLTTVPDPAPGARTPWATSHMEFRAWNGERWTAWVRGDLFELDPVNTDDWSRHAKATVAFIDWEGQPWQARVVGDEFLLAHRGVWNTEVVQARSIRYRDWQGQRQLRTVAQLRR